MNVTTPIDRKHARSALLTGDAWLAERHNPTLIIDPATHRLVTSNASGAEYLGIGDARSIELDASMPGWLAIKAHMAAGSNAAPHDETLLFWTATGPRAFKGRLETIRHEDRPLVLITIDPPTGLAAADGGALPPPPQQDDLATLREIARRIRAGTKSILAADQTTPAPEQSLDKVELNREPATATTSIEQPIQFPPPLNFQQGVQPDASAQPTAANDPEAIAGTVLATPLATLAHELGTPLSAIVSLAEIMRDERLGSMGNPRYKAYAADIHDSARHTLDLVRAMVERDGDKQHPAYIELDDIDLNDIARRCASAMQPIAIRGDVTLATTLDDCLPKVRANQRAIRQIIFNLLSNGLRFTPRGGKITIATSSNAGRGVQLAIIDTGTSMSQSDIARILGPYSANPGPNLPKPMLTNDNGGSGIGLPLVRQLVDAHGAKLEITSDANLGTRISITFAKDVVILK